MNAIDKTITDMTRLILDAEIRAGIERNALEEGETDDTETAMEFSAGIQMGCR